MTYKEAANIVDPYERGRALFKYNFFDRFEKQQEAYRIAAELLRKCGQNATEIKPDCNHPLTLEQLREMERPTPVWAKIKNKTVEGWAGYWCLCCHGNILTPGHISMYVGRWRAWSFTYTLSPTSTGRRGRLSGKTITEAESKLDLALCALPAICGMVNSRTFAHIAEEL